VTEACPVCASEGPEPLLEIRGHAIAACGACGVAYTETEEGGPDPETMYSEGYFTEGGAGYPDYVRDEPTHRRQARATLRKLGALGIAPGRLLDVGCAAGFFLDEARLAGWDVQGCDVSAYAAEHARTALGLDVRKGRFSDLALPAGDFDVVTLLNVFEHLPDPRRVVAALERIVRPGGHVVIETWDRGSTVARLMGRRWHQYAPPTVLFFYDRASLGRLFGGDAWEAFRWTRASKWISLAHGLSLLGHGRGREGPATLLGRDLLWRLGVPYALGDLVLAVVRRSSHPAGAGS
jgi:SAM-dependent methyltransferase